MDNNPYPTADELWLERRREQNRAWAAEQMQPYDAIMQRLLAEKDAMIAACKANGTDEMDVLCLFENAADWHRALQRAMED